MSYNPTQWKDGDLVTSAKLNKIEQGIAAGGGSGVPIIHATSLNGQPPVLDKTWQEIYDAGCGVIVLDINNYRVPRIITQIYQDNDVYKVVSLDLSTNGNTTFITDDPNSYPYIQTNENPGGTIAV